MINTGSSITVGSVEVGSQKIHSILSQSKVPLFTFFMTHFHPIDAFQL